MAKRTGKRGKGRVAPGTVAPDAPALPDTTGTEQANVGSAHPKARETSFKPGVSGNPAGRPKGARHRLSEAFISTLAKDFQEHGESAITKVRQDEPAQYLRVVSSLVPKAFDLGEDDEDGGNRIAGVALITRNAIEAIIERGRSDG